MEDEGTKGGIICPLSEPDMYQPRGIPKIHVFLTHVDTLIPWTSQGIIPTYINPFRRGHNPRSKTSESLYQVSISFRLSSSLRSMMQQ